MRGHGIILGIKVRKTMPNFKELAENDTGPQRGPVVEKFLSSGSALA